MDWTRFDSLARRLAEGREHTSRRTLLKAGGVAAGTTLAGLRPGRLMAQESTPAPAPAATRPPGGPTVARLAFDLEYDLEKIFAFVRDEVRYDPYAGILRGAKGTLWGLAGNAADQALLLADLLEEALVETRLVAGELDEEAVGLLEAESRWDEDTTRAHAAKVLGVANPGAEPVELPEPTAEQFRQAEELAAEGARAIEEVRPRIDATVELLHDALADAGIELPVLADELPERERTQHVWVQYRAGTEWVDLDPSIPDAEPGATYATHLQPLDEVPEELFHTVTIRAVAEVVRGGVAVEEEVVSYTARAADLAGEALTFVHLPPALFKAVGVAIEGALEERTQVIPTLIAADGGEAGVALTLATGDGGGVFGPTGPSDGQAIAEWLIYDVAPVDRPPRSERRAVFDRVGPMRRADGPFDVSALGPVEFVGLGDGQTGYLPLQAVTRIAVTGSEIPGGLFVQNYAVVDPAADMANGLLGQVLTRSVLTLDRMPETGVRLFPDAPGVSTITLAPTAITADRAEGTVTFDLVHQGLAAVSTIGTTPGTHPGVLGGVLDHTAERLTLEAAQRHGGFGDAPPVTVGRLFETALEEGVALLTLAPGATPGPDLDISNEARERIAAALRGGYAVIIPRRGVDLGGGPLSGWWQVDPVTGATFDRLETGQGGAALRGPFAEQVVNIQVGTRSIYAFKVMNVCLNLIVIGAGVMLAGGMGYGIGAGSVGAVAAGGLGGAVGLGQVGAAIACTLA